MTVVERRTAVSATTRDRVVTVPFNHRDTDPEAAHAAQFPISNESSYVNAHPRFLDGGHPGGIVRG